MELGWRKRRKLKEKGFKKMKPVVLSLNLERYEQYTCECCSRAPLKRNLSGETIMLPNVATVDHIIELSNGGTHELDNLQVLCFECNNTKSNSKGE